MADGRLGPTDLADLPISRALTRDLLRWQADWDATLDHDYPPDSTFPSAEHRFPGPAGP